MKYTVTYSCGHTGTVQLYGKQRNANARSNTMRNTVFARNAIKTETGGNEKWGFYYAAL